MRNAQRFIPLFLLTSACFASQITSDRSRYRDATGSREWGPWTGWSECSETCGFGTAYRIRQCHAHSFRHRNNSTCHGPSKQYKLCILKNCTDGRQDYRKIECAKHNNVYYGHKTYTWVPYINSASPCELSCRSLGFGYYARFQKTVADFVICNDENTAVCINGQCVKSGCDGILDSGTQLDRCGVCGGDGNSCRLIRGIFTHMHLTYQGYNIITTVPKGACSINITEMGRSTNHLALSTLSGYFLNGDMRLQAEGEVKGAGTTFTYNRNNGYSCPGECLTAPGPLNTTLRVELIYFGRNPGIYYHFTIPQEETGSIMNSMTSTRAVNDNLGFSQHAPRDKESYQNDADHSTRRNTFPRITHGESPIYLPDAENRNPQQRVHISSRVTSSKGSSLDPLGELVKTNEDIYRSELNKQNSVPEKFSKLRAKTDISRHVYNTDASSPKSLMDPNRDQYHVTGENGSVLYKHYYHTNIHDDIGDIPMVSQTDDDSGIHRDQGPSWLPSNSVYDTRFAEFHSTNQQKPSQVHNAISISQNHQDRDSTFSRAGSISGQRDYNGHDNMLNSHHVKAHLYSWRISGFTSCSEPCGGGLQETRVICVKEDSQVEVMEENCIQSIKPESTTIVCNNRPCEPKWEMNEWDLCSVTCGRGLQKRVVECKQRISPTLTILVSPSACTQPQPQTRQYCQLDPCFTWKMSQWTKCSSVCGFGQRTRTVSCVNSTGQIVAENLCTQIKPAEEEICDMGSCAQGWFHTRWSQECSSDCGRGYYTRQVFCSAADGTRLDEKKCGGKETKPKERKICKTKKPCGGQWYTGPWSQCSATCGANASRHRDVLCVKYHGKLVKHIVKDHNCVKEDKPPLTEPCHSLPACKPQWFVMSWSECSESCGTGVKIREVKCLDASLSPSPDCEKEFKPSRRQPCNTQPCKDKHVVTAQPQEPDIAANEALQMDGSAFSNSHPECKDSQSPRWCQLAKQARLCSYPHYTKVCCHTCRKLDPKHF